MKKNYLAAIFFLTQLFFTGCIQNFNDTETVTFQLPQWPADDSFQLPELSRWRITLSSGSFTNTFYTSLSTLLFETQKNQPLSIIAEPLTKLPDSNKEINFFYPAGAIYPYDSQVLFKNIAEKEIIINLTWEKGYTASLMEKIINSRTETGITETHMNKFLKSFNWKKLQNSIDDKIYENLRSYENAENPVQIKFYNPWQIDTQSLLDNLCYACFSLSSIQPRNLVTIKAEAAKLESAENLWSRYVPENYIIRQYNQFGIQKNTPYYLLVNDFYIAEISGTSSKKLSVDFTYVPIFYSDL